jgi:hypothetical protein
LWSQKPKDQDADSFNVSKAFRRLEAFASYQMRMFEPYFSTPVDTSSPEIQKVGDLMNTKIPAELHEGTGSVVWVMDLALIDLDAMCKLEEQVPRITHRDIMRWFWGLMLISMFDDVAASEGVIILQGFGDLGMSGMMQSQKAFKPIESDMNAMFYGIMPFKMKSCVLVGSPWWMSALLAFMKLFISKKMSSRILNLSQDDMLEYMGGAAGLPDGYLGGTGKYVPRYGEHMPEGEDETKAAAGAEGEEQVGEVKEE